MERDVSVKYASMALNVLNVLDAGAEDAPEVHVDGSFCYISVFLLVAV